MSENIVLTFALLFGATISLICAVYVYLIYKSNTKKESVEEESEEVNYY